LRATVGVPEEAPPFLGKDDGMSTTVLPRQPGTGRGLRSITELLDVNAEVGVATVKVDLADVTEATVEVGTAARFAANALMGQLLAERLLGLDISPRRAKWT
jgi:hypothetical protein